MSKTKPLYKVDGRINFSQKHEVVCHLAVWVGVNNRRWTMNAAGGFLLAVFDPRGNDTSRGPKQG